MRVYLAGAIRDDRPEDIEWREDAISALSDVADVLNPVGGKTYDPDTHQWRLHGQLSSAQTIVKHDFWCIDNVDAVIFNLLALSEGYPNIGTLVEFGRATANGLLIYSIVATGYKGHGNTSMYKLHPFIEQNSARVFNDVETCIDFAVQHFACLSGLTPRFGGVRSSANVHE